MRKITGTFFLLAMFACNSPEPASSVKIYFDVKSYFEKETARLSAINPTVSKTVSVDGKIESKSLKIADWKRELAIFASADINKPGWKGLFKTKKEGTSVIYTTGDEKVQIKRLEINRDQETIKHISIVIMRSNLIYTSTDTLHYYPDSIYSINKIQNIKLVSGRQYKVTGKFR